MDDFYLKKIINGDTGSFRYFINKYKDIGYSLAVSVVKDEFLAQEVLQTAFINAYSGLSSFKGKSRFSTWFYRIVTNEAFKTLKKQKKNNFTDLESLSVKLPESDYFEINALEEDQRYYINQALKKMNPNESLALRLFYLEECSVEEITEITGWSSSNVKVILHRGRNNMREIMERFFKKEKMNCHEKY